MKVSAGTITRTVVLMLALVNTLLTAWGKNPLPWSEEELYAGVSSVVTVAAAIVAWWRNNSFTRNAIAADSYKDSLNEAEKAAEKGMGGD